ncbi:MAG: hypothetical protein KDI01_02445, partial [Halioglobus sp.]|nr:hypothetical protein [Halioglobus sp.]
MPSRQPLTGSAQDSLPAHPIPHNSTKLKPDIGRDPVFSDKAAKPNSAIISVLLTGNESLAVLHLSIRCASV